MDNYKKQILQRAIDFYIEKADVDKKTIKTVSCLMNDLEAINYTRCCTELKTVKQGENSILDNKFDVEVITPESSVLIKHKHKDRLIWVDKQRLKRK